MSETASVRVKELLYVVRNFELKKQDIHRFLKNQYPQVSAHEIARPETAWQRAETGAKSQSQEALEAHVAIAHLNPLTLVLFGVPTFDLKTLYDAGALQSIERIKSISLRLLTQERGMKSDFSRIYAPAIVGVLKFIDSSHIMPGSIDWQNLDAEFPKVMPSRMNPELSPYAARDLEQYVSIFSEKGPAPLAKH